MLKLVTLASAGLLFAGAALAQAVPQVVTPQTTGTTVQGTSTTTTTATQGNPGQAKEAPKPAPADPKK